MGRIQVEILDKAIADICDNYCKYPNMCKDEDTLYQICERCPLEKVEEVKQWIETK